MLLLLWTAADLSNSSLCALDSEGTDAVSSSTHEPLSAGSNAPAPVQTPERHIDDCFCCSHCVDVQTFAPAILVMAVELQRTPLVLAAPRLFGAPLYHPPLA